jgi:hypothetical protein
VHGDFLITLYITKQHDSYILSFVPFATVLLFWTLFYYNSYIVDVLSVITGVPDFNFVVDSQFLLLSGGNHMITNGIQNCPRLSQTYSTTEQS